METKLTVGNRVRHKNHGLGTVTGNQDGDYVEIHFDIPPEGWPNPLGVSPQLCTKIEPMTPNNYVEQALRSAPEWTGNLAISARFDGNFIDLIYAQLGISSEAGEFADACKKFFIYGKSIDKENLKEEIGDICWYLALACRAIDANLEDIMQANIAKLKLRYPDKFTEKDALERKDKYPVCGICEEKHHPTDMCQIIP